MITLVLVIGVVAILQSAGLANAKLLKKAAYAQREDMARRAVRELARPLGAEALSRDEAEVGFETKVMAVEFDGVGFEVGFRKTPKRSVLGIMLKRDQ